MPLRVARIGGQRPRSASPGRHCREIGPLSFRLAPRTPATLSIDWGVPRPPRQGLTPRALEAEALAGPGHARLSRAPGTLGPLYRLWPICTGPRGLGPLPTTRLLGHCGPAGRARRKTSHSQPPPQGGSPPACGGPRSPRQGRSPRASVRADAPKGTPMFSLGCAASTRGIRSLTSPRRSRGPGWAHLEPYIALGCSTRAKPLRLVVLQVH